MYHILTAHQPNNTCSEQSGRQAGRPAGQVAAREATALLPGCWDSCTARCVGALIGRPEQGAGWRRVRGSETACGGLGAPVDPGTLLLSHREISLWERPQRHGSFQLSCLGKRVFKKGLHFSLSLLISMPKFQKRQAYCIFWNHIKFQWDSYRTISAVSRGKHRTISVVTRCKHRTISAVSRGKHRTM